MVSHLVRHNLLSSHQHGFLKGHLTGLQILECMNDWFLSIDCGKYVDVFISISVVHLILCLFLNYYIR